MKYSIAKFSFSGKNGGQSIPSDILQISKDLLMSIAGEAGFESFEETAEGVNGYIQAHLFNKTVLDKGLEEFPIPSVKVDYGTADAENKNWNETWESAGFEPIVIGGKCVVHDALHPYEGEQLPIRIQIDAKQAFGTGTHETTRMIIDRLLTMNLNGKRVLDCGCGTGILSMVAAKGGAKEIVGYDIDEWSVDNTKHNATLNNVENIKVFLGDAHVISHISGVFDVVLANINRNILLEDMPKMCEVMSAGAAIIFSGFYTKDSMAIAKKAEELGLSLNKNACDNDWCMMEFTKP
ncbi:MAG: 50S ribosomal protein L11 methyltransferase [Prevotella sp.]|nr:50S ribosomal protein L11 methyltransferase [Prevotella sp.]